MENKKKIFIIDDEEDLRENIADLLEDLADEFIEASDGLDAMEKYKIHEPFDCIVCDINMPRMNGVEVIKAIRELGDEKTPFIFFTAFGSRALMLQAIKYGAFDFIDKPHFENLTEIVSNALSIKKTDDTKDENLISEYKKLFDK